MKPIDKEATQIEALLEAQKAQTALAKAVREDYQTTVHLLHTYQAILVAVEGAGNLERKRDIIERTHATHFGGKNSTGRQKATRYRALFRLGSGDVSLADSAADFGYIVRHR